MNAVLRAEGLVVRRGRGDGRFELAVAELELRAGEALAVLGPNGAGKSTLLRALAGLEPPAAGRVVRATGGAVTMVFQRPFAFDGSVEHNVRAALLGLSLGRAARRARIREALAHFGIERLAARSARGLSGGELRRLALARAFALEPAVLLLDEPFDDLDADAQESLSIDLRRAIAATRVAVAIVTHDLRRAVLLCDRMAVLIAGRLRQQGSRELVLRRPATPEVARLVGMTNLIAGHVRSPRAIEVAPDCTLEIESAHPAGTVVYVGIRAEDLKLEDGRGGGLSLGKARVHQVVSDGALCTLRLDWHGLELRTHLIAGRGLARSLSHGDSVALSVRPDDVHVMAI